MARRELGAAGTIFFGSYCPARRHRVWAALRASLRDGFASLDPAPTRKDPAPTRKTGDEQVQGWRSWTSPLMTCDFAAWHG
jgi:hypothetical protein